MIAALVLAAGAGRRLGRVKQLEPWGGITLLEHVLSDVRTFPVDEIWVVLGFESERIMSDVNLEGCYLIENPEWEEGIASSIRAGLDALTRLSQADQALLILGDEPDISLEVVQQVMTEHRRAKALATLPKYRYLWGHPVLVDRRLWPRLISLTGDEGAKQLLKAHPEWVHEVWVADRAPRDVDTPQDVIDLRPH